MNKELLLVAAFVATLAVKSFVENRDAEEPTEPELSEAQEPQEDQSPQKNQEIIKSIDSSEIITHKPIFYSLQEF